MSYRKPSGRAAGRAAGIVDENSQSLDQLFNREDRNDRNRWDVEHDCFDDYQRRASHEKHPRFRPWRKRDPEFQGVPKPRFDPGLKRKSRRA